MKVTKSVLGFMAGIACTAASGVYAKADNWQDLFNGKDLNGWQQLGTAKDIFSVDGGVIVGRYQNDTDNQFLVFKRKYKNFVLEFDVNLDQGINSGVQFRSRKNKAGKLSGYQVELDASDRAWSGGIYEEKGRGWLYNLSRNSECQQAFKPQQWNQIKVEAIGNHVRSWVNSVECADILDYRQQSGLIGLQVHGIDADSALAGKTVRWKNIRLKSRGLKAAPAFKGEQFSYLNNTLSKREKAQGWSLLWDGKTTQGWRGAKLKQFPATGWQIDDGVLSVLSSDGGESTNGGDIISDREFSNFELEVDFNITQAANSGIKYFVDPNLLKGKGSAIGLEFQILDDIGHPDAKRGVKGNRTVGSLYDLITAANLSEPSNDKKRFNGVGKWNRARIVVRGSKVEHWLNNIKVVEYERGTQMFRALVAYSKYAKWPNFGEWSKGPILLQDHGDFVSFRNIKIRELSQ